MSKTCTNTHERSANKPERLGDIGEAAWVYLIKSGAFVKIGMTKSPMRRIPNICTSNPHDFHVLTLWRVPYAKRRKIEAVAHERLNEADLHHFAEWFVCSVERARQEVVAAACQEVGADSFCEDRKTLEAVRKRCAAMRGPIRDEASEAAFREWKAKRASAKPFTPGEHHD